MTEQSNGATDITAQSSSYQHENKFNLSLDDDNNDNNNNNEDEKRNGEDNININVINSPNLSNSSILAITQHKLQVISFIHLIILLSHNFCDFAMIDICQCFLKCMI